MQPHTVLAFRKRLSSWGYRDISIRQKRNDDGVVVPGLYVVKAIEPLAGLCIEVERTVSWMHHSFR